ncbi:MAG: transposase [Gemmataceae bacterium]
MKGHRPLVGTRDCKGVLCVFGVLNLLTGAVHANTLESLQSANRKDRKAEGNETRRMQQAFADHLRHVARAYPAGQHERVVLLIDNAPWHRGRVVDEALAECPHLEFKRLPSYGPQLNPAERFRKKLRRRATHDRLFDTITDLRSSVRNSLRYFQTVKGKLLTMINGRPKKTPQKRSHFSGNVYE